MATTERREYRSLRGERMVPYTVTGIGRDHNGAPTWVAVDIHCPCGTDIPVKVDTPPDASVAAGVACRSCVRRYLLGSSAPREFGVVLATASLPVAAVFTPEPGSRYRYRTTDAEGNRGEVVWQSDAPKDG